MAWRGLFISIMAIVWLTACGDPAANSEKMLQTAKDYIKENSPREAALELKNALQENPANAEARYLLGLLNLDFGDSEGAEKEFQRASQAGWNEEQVQVGLARALVSGNQYQQMLDEVEIKDHYSPTVKADLYGLRAIALTALGKKDLASQSLKQGKALDPNALQVMKALIQQSVIDEDYNSANQALQEALKSHPDNPELLLFGAIIALKTNDVQKADARYQRVIELEPSNIVTIYGRQARLRLGHLQIIDKQYDKASATLKPLFRQYANDPETNFIGGMLAFSKGNYDLAEERLLKVLKVAPNHVPTQLLFGTVNYQQKNYEQAEHYLSQYLQSEPQNLGARKLLGRTYMMLGQSDKAQSVLKPALGTEVPDPELLALVGLNELRGGKTSAGLENLQKAVEVAPESTALRTELAKAYITSGDAEQAIKELNAILLEGGDKGTTETLLIVAHLKAGQPDKAIEIALKILSENPDKPAAMTLAGNVFAASGDLKEARNYLNQALQLDAKNVQANLSLARLEEMQGDEAKASTIYEEMVGADTNTIVPMLALARLAEKQGQKETMFKWLQKAYNHEPKQLQALIILAEAYLREKEWDKAETIIKEAKKIDEKNTSVLAQWCRLLMAEQRFNEALPYLLNLTEAEPDSVFARLLLAENYLNLGQTDDARKVLDVALNKQPDSLGALSLMGSVALKSKQFDQAEEYAARIIKINSNLPVGYELTGDAQFGRGNFQEAKSAYKKAWELKPAADLAIKISMAAVRLESPDEAVSILKSWLKDHADDVRAQQFLGTTLQNLGRDSEAIERYEHVLKLQPDNIVALNNLAGLYAKNPRTKAQALEMAEKAYQVNPDNAGIKDTYGWILLQQDQSEKGFRLIRQAYDELSNLPEVKYHYAAGLIKTGKKAQGIEMLKSLLAAEKRFEGRDEAERLLTE